MKDLAVLIPVYQDRKGLEVALSSIRERDNSFTVVVVDGNSDAPTEINQEAYPFKVVVIGQDERPGIIGGLNTGLDYIHAHGFTFLARLDAGDRQQINRLSIQYERLKNSENLAMIGSNAAFMSEETGKPLFVTDLPLQSKDIRKWSVFQTCFIHPTVMIRLDRVNESFRYQSKYLHIEDYILFTDIAENYETENLPEPLVECFVRENGISRKNDRAQLISGLRHHLRQPKFLTPLWYAYLFKRTIYLMLPYPLRVRIKTRLKFVSSPPNAISGPSPRRRHRARSAG